ncbi:MAG: hypothetical protein KatS3mg105_4066 [Gemmatales bacterium]|nr:MAG: hypothetical protein KatS3mg105_4066 [Gemmatales bacterium]
MGAYSRIDGIKQKSQESGTRAVHVRPYYQAFGADRLAAVPLRGVATAPFFLVFAVPVTKDPRGLAPPECIPCLAPNNQK